MKWTAEKTINIRWSKNHNARVQLWREGERDCMATAELAMQPKEN